MKFYNIFFSPTGTSAKVAAAVSDAFETAYVTFDLTDLNNQGISLSLSDDDFAVIAAPVYGGKMASIAKERMKSIKAHNTPCLLIAVYGNRAFENALKDMADFVTEIGFRPVGAGAFIGEHSYSTDEYPIAVGRPDYDDLLDAKAFGREAAKKLMNKELKDIDVSLLHDTPVPEESIRNFRSFVMSYQQRQKESPVRILPEVDVDKCNGCGKCLEVCPTAAISSDYIKVDSSLCIKCCACVKECPEGARTLSSPFAPVLSANFSQRKPPLWII